MSATRSPVDSLPSSAHYRFEPLSDGLTFAQARAEGGALSNSGLIDLGAGTLVFDTSLTPVAAEDLARAARAATGREPTAVANSHWHLDHLLGNQVFASLAIYATRRTREILDERGTALRSEISAETLMKDVRELEEKLRSATSEDARTYLASVLEMNRWVLRCAGSLRLTSPNRTFESRLRLPGSRGAELLSFGAGHTESDAVLHVPDAGLLFAGDLVVVGTHPNLLSGDPAHWIVVLREIAALRPERIVPGHGPVASAEALAAMEDYLATILAMAGDRREEIPARFRDLQGPDQFRANLEFVRGSGAASRT
jgi:cyclase